MLKTVLLTTALLTAPMLATAQEKTPITGLPAGVYTLDETHTSVTWKVSHMGLSNYTARFASTSGSLTLDPKDVTKSKLSVSVDPASVKTDYPHADKKDFDAELKGKDWFNTAEFSKITFDATKIVKTSETTGDVTGNLTFHGVTKPLTLHVTFNGGYAKKPMVEAPGVGFSATATLKRSDWGLANYVPMIGDDVTLLIETEFNKLK